MDLDHAIEKHAEWKMRLRAAIMRHETVDLATVAADDRCELGKWLHGEGRRLFGSLGGFLPCVARHAEFHAQAGKIAQAINAGRYAEAELMLNGNSPYANASSTVGAAILRLKKETVAA